MAPHRVEHAQSTLQALSGPAIWSVVLGLWSILTGLQVVGFVLLLGAMLADAWAGASRARKDKVYSAKAFRRGLRKKLGLLTYVLLAFLADGVLLMMSQATGLWKGKLDVGWVTLFVLTALFWSEVMSALDNLRDVHPEAHRAVFGRFRAALQATRIMDERNWQSRYGPDAPVPRRRQTDAALVDLDADEEQEEEGGPTIGRGRDPNSEDAP